MKIIIEIIHLNECISLYWDVLEFKVWKDKCGTCSYGKVSFHAVLLEKPKSINKNK